jgi:hypothetical protein
VSTRITGRKKADQGKVLGLEYELHGSGLICAAAKKRNWTVNNLWMNVFAKI